MTNIFSNREIASFIWIVIGLIWLLQKENARKSIGRVIKTIFRRPISSTLLFSAIYIFFLSFGLSNFISWQGSYTKSAVMWWIFSGTSLLFHANDHGIGRMYPSRIVLDHVKIIMVIEYLANMQSFSFGAELATFPFVVLVAAITAIESISENAKSITPMINFMLGVYGLVVLFSTFYNIYSKPGDFFTLPMLMDFVLPVIFLLFFLPFIYFLVLYIAYDSLFRRVGMGAEKSKSLKRKIRWEIFKACGINIKRCSIAANMTVFNIMTIREESEIEKMRLSYDRQFKEN